MNRGKIVLFLLIIFLITLSPADAQQGTSSTREARFKQ